MRVGLVAPAVLCAAVVGCARAASSHGGSGGTGLTMSSRPPSYAAPAAAPGNGAPAPPADPPEAREARDRLVARIVAEGPPWPSSGPWDPRVLEAVRAVPRHFFFPRGPDAGGAGSISESTLRQAYEDQPYPIGYGQTISQPTVVAVMTQALGLTGSERVLEIGTGSGYQAAILSMLAREVYTIEIVPELGEEAARRLVELGRANVHVRIGDGYAGWPEKVPFDRIVLTAAPPEVPKALLQQLADGGVLVGPVGAADDVQDLVRWTKRGQSLEREMLGKVRFVPMVPAR